VTVLPTAFVFLRVKLGTSEFVYDALKRIPNIQEAFMVYGKYDIIVKIVAVTMAELKHFVTYTIRQQGNIRATQTMVVID
jgi:DNA-binding Lrp family transcriptional regulator